MNKIISLIAMLLACISQISAQKQYTLEQIVDSAVHNNYAIHKAQYQIEAAQQQRKEAFTKYFANVSVTGIAFNANKGMAQMSLNPSEMIPAEIGGMLAQSVSPEVMAALANPISISMMKNGVIGSVMAVQPVYAGGQIVNGNKLAKVGEDVSRLQLQLSKNEIEKNAEGYFWQVVSLQEKIKTLDAADALLNDVHKDASIAVKARVAMGNDLLQVELRQNENKSSRLKLQNGLSLIKMLLSQYCGLKDTTFCLKPAPIEQEMVSIIDGDTTLSMLPEYQLLQKQVEASQLQTKMERGKNMPSLAVGAGYNFHNLLGTNQSFGMVFATVSIPISSWWGGSHALKRKKLEERRVEEELSDNASMLRIRMQKARNDVAEAYQQLALAKQGIVQAEENLRIQRNYYKAGTSKMSDLLEAQLLFQQCEGRRVDAEANYHNMMLEYKQAMGL